MGCTNCTHSQTKCEFEEHVDKIFSSFSIRLRHPVFITQQIFVRSKAVISQTEKEKIEKIENNEKILKIEKNENFEHLSERSNRSEISIESVELVNKVTLHTNFYLNNLDIINYGDLIQNLCRSKNVEYDLTPENQIHPLDEYWIELYEQIPEKFKYIYTKFIFNLLGNNSGDFYSLSYFYVDLLMEYKFYCDQIYDSDLPEDAQEEPEKNKNLKITNKSIIITPQDEIKVAYLFLLIYFYVYSITKMTMKFFKYNFFDKSIKENSFYISPVLSENWSDSVIRAYVNKTFFDNDLDMKQNIKIKSFVYIHFNRLTNDKLIRSELEEFYLEYLNSDEKNKYKKNNFF